MAVACNNTQGMGKLITGVIENWAESLQIGSAHLTIRHVGAPPTDFVNRRQLDLSLAIQSVDHSMMDEELKKRLKFLLHSASHYSLHCPQLAAQLT